MLTTVFIMAKPNPLNFREVSCNLPKVKEKQSDSVDYGKNYIFNKK